MIIKHKVRRIDDKISLHIAWGIGGVLLCACVEKLLLIEQIQEKDMSEKVSMPLDFELCGVTYTLKLCRVCFNFSHLVCGVPKFG